MNGSSGPRDKLDTIDLIITALKEHEKLLDALYGKLEVVVDKLSVKEPERISEAFPLVSCDKWSDFKCGCEGANAVAFKVRNNTLTFYAKSNGEVFRYSEKIPRRSFKVVDEGKRFLVEKIYVEDFETLPSLNGTLRCGLRLPVKASKTALNEGEFLLKMDYTLDSSAVKEFLSRELSVSESKIVEGRITV
jgi:hypothetical protein